MDEIDDKFFGFPDVFQGVFFAFVAEDGAEDDAWWVCTTDHEEAEWGEICDSQLTDRTDECNRSGDDEI